MEKIFEFLGWTNGQISRFWEWVDLFRNFSFSGFSFKRFFAGILAAFELFNAAAFKTAVHPYGKELDLSDYTLVFSDEFDADELDTDVWYTRANGARRSGYNGASQIRQENGNLIITGEYLENGEYGEGWYAGAVALKQKYTKGYFEIRCICNDSKDFWSAFWFQGNHSYDPELSKGGIGGAEIDIFEAFGNGKRREPYLSVAVVIQRDDVGKLRPGKRKERDAGSTLPVGQEQRAVPLCRDRKWKDGILERRKVHL